MSNMYFKSLIDIICHSLGANAIRIDVHISPYFLLPMNIMVSLGIITNELITNSIKHAFTHTLNPIISLVLNIQEDYYHFIYTDNGSSCSQEGLFSQNGLGNHLIQLSIEQLNATLQVTLTPSLQYTILFKEAA
jgi:Signal transduction histidine kinase